MDEKIISVQVPQGTIYVSGSVNGVDCEWENISGNTWQTIANRSKDDKYIVELTITNSNGTTKTEFILWLGKINLITDRTLNDVNTAKKIVEKISNSSATELEIQKFLQGLKGYYNYFDLNRVESAVSYLCEKIKTAPSEIRKYANESYVAWDDLFDLQIDTDKIQVSVKLDWSIKDYFDFENQARYLTNVRFVGGILGDDVSYLPTSFKRFNYESANAVEKCLFNLDINVDKLVETKKEYIDKTANSWHYCNEIYGGELN